VNGDAAKAFWKALRNTNVERLAVAPSEEEVIRWLQVFKTKLEMAGLQTPVSDDLPVWKLSTARN